MSSSSAICFNNSTFNPLEQHKQSLMVAGFLLVIVVMLHVALGLFFLKAPNIEHKKPLVIMEVVMLPKPEPVIQHVAKEPPPAIPPPAKKQTIKPRPVVKSPKPVKKPVVEKKPAPTPKPQPTLIKEIIPVPKFEPGPPVKRSTPIAAPESVAAPSAPSISHSSAKITGQGRDNSNTIVSGIVPLVRVPPKYPSRAANRHIEGWVKVEFTVQADGSVDNAAVIASEPEGIFDDAALTAIGKWKFKEKIVNGVAVKQRAVQKLQFKLEH